MKIALKDHAGAGIAIAVALQEAGHTFETGGEVDLLLVDLDCPRFGYRELIDHFADQGAIVLQYPHGATANLPYDSLYDPYEKVHGQLTTGAGEAEFLRRLGITRPTLSVGWSYCRQYPFRARDEVRKVVFAPTHPNGDGSMLPHRKERNGEVFRALLSGDWQITVRYIGSFDQCGLWFVPGVRYVQGTFDMNTAEIDGTDVVVAGSGTYPALAIARGVPTVMYGQSEGAVYGLDEEDAEPLKRLHLYEDVTRYPVDVDDGPIREVVARAARDDDVIASWRERWIGEPLDAPKVAREVEALVRDLQRGRSMPRNGREPVASTEMT